jgi:hypothetical protein
MRWFAPLAVFALFLASTPAAAATSLRDRIGVAHAGGKYSVDSDGRDYLNEGAHQIRYGLGSRVIKLWMTRTPASLYAFNSPWWIDAPLSADLTTVADHMYFRQVFSMPFSTFILVVDAPDHVWFGNGMWEEEEDAEERAMYALARFLMERYAGSGKTFILQNWEADWLLRLGVSDSDEPSPMAVEGMIRWLNARQRGVERARRELAHLDGVTLKHAVEVNHVWRAKHEPWRASVTNDVLPSVQADMYSYSAWEASSDVMLREMLTYLDERTAGEGNIYVGEYGAPENGGSDHLKRIAALTNAALDWGAVYVVYWQLYCNEFAFETRISSPGRVLNSDMRGFWLVRPDGSKSRAWGFLRALIRPALPVGGRIPERVQGE